MKKAIEESEHEAKSASSSTQTVSRVVPQASTVVTKSPDVRHDEGAVRFEKGWRTEIDRSPVPGGTLEIVYEPARLPRNRGAFEGRPAWDITASVLFRPTNELFNGSVVDPTGGHPEAAVPFRVPVPGGAEWVEIWFANTQRPDLVEWDSQFGRNYRFEIDRLPFQDVAYRSGAVPSLEMVNVLREEVGASLTPERGVLVRLSVLAWVRNVAFEKHTWCDCHLYDEARRLIEARTMGLGYVGSAEGDGDAFGLDQVVHRALLMSPRPVWLRYRLYYETGGVIYSDAIVHELRVS